MRGKNLILGLVQLAVAAVVGASPVCAPAADYKPQVGQPGKDVVWVPSADAVVNRMLHMAQVTPADIVVDLGSGDGRIAIVAAKKFGARALGIEFNPDMVALSRRNARAAGVAERATFRRADLFETDFSQATVVTMYLLPELTMKLRPRLLALRPGTRVVSHDYHLEDWEPDETSILGESLVFLWIVPAPVGGTWTLTTSAAGVNTAYRIALDQRFQTFTGTVALGRTLAGLREPRLRGANIDFSLVDDEGVARHFSGRVSGDRMQGSYRAVPGTGGSWSALRRRP